MSGKGRLSDAVWTAFTEALRFIVVPLVLVDLVTSNYPQLSTAFMSEIGTFVMFFGGMIVASSTLEAIHRPGTYKRLLFGMCGLAFVGMWMFVIFGGGIAEFSYGPYFVRFDITKIVYIVLAGISLKALLVYMTFSVNRRAEVERARKRRVEDAEKLRQQARNAKKMKAARAAATLSFERMSSAEFDVTADDDIGYTPSAYVKDLPTGMKICEVCGAQSPTKDYVCKNCGSWFPRDSVI
jgi:ribosomal protein L40E